MNRLRASACYLAGPMTHCDDLGRSWREEITPHLQRMGVAVLDPTQKPIEIGIENEEARETLARMREAGDLEGVRDFIKVIRRVDLRCVDLSSFLIVRLDGTPTIGTYEEIALAVSQSKPVLLWLAGDLKRNNVNGWLLAQVQLDYVFESMEDLLEYLRGINESEQHPNDRRWMLFDFASLYKEVLAADLLTEEAERLGLYES